MDCFLAMDWISKVPYLRSYNDFLRCLSFRIFAAATDVKMQIIFNRCVCTDDKSELAKARQIISFGLVYFITITFYNAEKN